MAAKEGNPKTTLTPKGIAKLPRRANVYEVSDAGARGLRLRVHPTGVKSFRWYVSALGRVITIGPWSESPAPAHVTLEEARDVLRDLKKAHKAGVRELDRAEVKIKTALAPRAVSAVASEPADSVNKWADRFFEHLEGRRRRPEEAKNIIKRHILPAIGAKSLADVKRSDCDAIVEAVVQSGAAVHAGKVLALLKQLLSWSTRRAGDDFTNPAAELKADDFNIETVERDRFLSADELPIFWNALDPDPAGSSPKRSVPEPQTAAALRLLLLTAVRSQELRLARWTEVDFAAATWTVPIAHQKMTKKQERSKRAKPFVIPLTPTALGLFEQLRALSKGADLVLPSPEDPSRPYAEKTLGRAMRRVWRTHPALKQLPEAAPHDLRRTVRTWLGDKLGVEWHVCERVLNHRIGGKANATYDRGDYLEARRAALEKWDALLQRLVNSNASNVVPFPAAGVQ